MSKRADIKADIERRFTENLLRILNERGITEAAASRAAGLNPRFVTDLKIGHTRSPRLANAYAMADFLGLDIKDIIEGRSKSPLNQALVDLLSEYPEAEQQQILAAVTALAGSRGRGRPEG